MSEAGEQTNPVGSSAAYVSTAGSVASAAAAVASAATPPPTSRKPSRPAPPVPVREQFEHSKEVLFGRKHAVIAVAGFRHDRAWVAGGGSNRCPVTRRNLRHRKIHSLRRQIQIKEKMLEVRGGGTGSGKKN